MNNITTSFITIVIMTVAYSAVHSILAAMRIKEKIRQVFGPPSDRYYRLVYNLISVLSFLPVLFYIYRNRGLTLYSLQGPWLFVALVVQGFALLLLAAGLWQTGPWQFLGLSQLIGDAKNDENKLVVRGLYRWVRHPLYSAGLLFIWFSPVMTTSLLALNLTFTAYIYIGSIFEERRLRAELGPAYATYQQSVPRLIPRLIRRR
jgi:protein-S-isoprenylcysteine O-methyltransferase Ste14